MQQPEATPTEAGTRGFYYRQGRGNGNCRVKGVAALGKNSSASLSRDSGVRSS